MEKLSFAMAQLRGGQSAPQLRGQVYFEAHPEGTLVTASVWGLPESPTGFFGIHIHEGGGCSGQEFSETGSHWDLENLAHPLHTGDLPPLLSVDGAAWLSVLTGRFRVDQVVGHTVVIHGGPDDFTSQPAGNAGKKIACGSILPVWEKKIQSADA